IATEPEKRYVGRFIRSYLPLLQIATILALPLALVILAVVVPTINIISLKGGILSAVTFYDPVRILFVLLMLGLFYISSYAILGWIVISVLQISRIEREQPDMIVTTPEQIARYDSIGNLAAVIPWRQAQQWVALDRCNWERPLSLYSQTFLEDNEGRDLAIDGITGWYNDIQADIGQRLERVGSTVERQNVGYQLFKSKSGIAILVEVILLLLLTVIENQLLPLPLWFPTGLYAFLSFVTFSGVLIFIPLGYWLVNRPLTIQSTLLLNHIWPRVLMVFGALPVLLYVISGGTALPINALNYSSFVWGVYTLTEALVARYLTKQRILRFIIVSVATVIALLIVSPPAYASYRWQVGYTAKGQIAAAAAVSAAPTMISDTRCSAAIDARALGDDIFSSYSIQGDCAAMTGQWQKAAGYYQQAADHAATGSGERALALYNLWNALRRYDRSQSDLVLGELDTLCSTSTRAAAICVQIANQLSTP
ncbi:MAG: hypothetical protein HGA19_10835, partial [Oscillochloris sp.]|nr:hypothetical protein [Oscillochloris sp.]